jgi:CRISPR-associated endonuclease/helicase Cas3
MIGSGLLFSRYARGFKTRPLHAGFLAQDALLVHDEAHLEPAFQTLLGEIESAQRESNEFRPLRVLALTATSRAENKNGEPPFTLTDADHKNETVKERVNAVKRLSLSTLIDGKDLNAKLLTLAKEIIGERAVLIFARSVETVIKVTTELDKGERKGKVTILTGTMRGKERDELVSKDPVFQRFLPEKDRAKNVVPATGTVYLVATSAGEVGVNISADDLVCDLSTYESMAQRFGRVNRFGHRDDSRITVVHETKFDTAKPLEAARERTLALLRKLDGDASPAALDKLPADARGDAFSPPPEIRVATAVQFDAWALTSMRKPIAARPPIAPYLHGEAEWQPPETHIAWRDDRDFQHIKDPEAFLDDFPLKSAELLRDTSDRISETLGDVVAATLQEEKSLSNGWLIDAFGNAKAIPLAPFALSAKPKKERTKDEAEELKRVKELLADATLLLPATLGGLGTNGIFSASAKFPASDCSGIERRESDTRENAADLSLEISNENADEPRFLLWFAPKSSGSAAIHGGNRAPETLAAHTAAVIANAAAIAAKVFPGTPAAGQPDLGHCLVVAARLHDLGKNRAQWQRNLGNLAYDPANPNTIFAKSGGNMRPRNVAEHYRHEFGSILDAKCHADFTNLHEAERDIVLHLVAAHHGRARPYFPAEEIFDYSGNITAPVVAAETPRRFARLQKRFGRWGLAWLESLLRAADYAASAGIVAQANPSISVQAAIPSQVEQSPNTPQPEPTATLVVNPANPGHYFACCGLFELASCLSPEALAWFEQTAAGFRFHLANTPPLSDLLKEITTAELSAENDEPEGEEETDEDADEKESEKEASAPPLRIGEPFNLRLDWWTTALPSTSALKVWAGSMKVLRIAISMRQTVHEIVQSSPMDLGRILSDARISLDPFKIKKAEEKSAAQYEADMKAAYAKRDEALSKAVAEKAGEKLEKEKTKIEAKHSEACAKAVRKRDDNIAKARAKAKTEPFYFDANRGPNSDARDIGFSPNDLKLRTLAAPAAEFLTLAGLQRAIPQPSGNRRFDYHLWQTPIPIALLAAAINGFTEPRPQPSFRFESWFRTSQRKHKAFLPAKSL